MKSRRTMLVAVIVSVAMLSFALGASPAAAISTSSLYSKLKALQKQVTALAYKVAHIPAGKTGASGPRGDAGPTGSQGATGSVGPKGDSANTSTIDALQTTVASQANQIAALQAGIDALQNRVTVLEGRADETSATVVGDSSRIDGIDSAVAALQSVDTSQDAAFGNIVPQLNTLDWFPIAGITVTTAPVSGKPGHVLVRCQTEKWNTLLPWTGTGHLTLVEAHNYEVLLDTDVPIVNGKGELEVVVPDDLQGYGYGVTVQIPGDPFQGGVKGGAHFNMPYE